eukprot:scaffold122461_cov27-Tisochrysis_lutea.AAC.3
MDDIHFCLSCNRRASPTTRERCTMTRVLRSSRHRPPCHRKTMGYQGPSYCYPRVAHVYACGRPPRRAAPLACACAPPSAGA